MRENLENKKGITLIALIITIVVLIILAGVVISLTLSQNGILEKSKKGKEKYEIATAKEFIEIKINECIIEKNGEASLQDIVDYLAEDNNITYYISLEPIGLVVGKTKIGTAKEIYVVYNRYQFKIDENKKVEFISIVDVDLEGEISIEVQVKKYLGKNEQGKNTVSMLLRSIGDANIEKVEIQDEEGIITTIEPEGLTTEGKEITIELDKQYKIILTTENGNRYIKRIIEKSEETIVNTEQLANFRDKVNSGLTYEGKTIKLGADIDLSSVCGANINGKEISWEPIGTTTFNGTFDGNMYTIKGIYINNNKEKQGLFGSINKGTIKNVILEGKITAGNCIGGICGICNGGIIEKCINKVEVIGTGDINKYNGYVGGIAGKTDSNSKITSCINKADIVGVSAVGGITGMSTQTEIENCYNVGNITGTGALTNNEVDLGGITGGIMGNKVNNCYNAGKVQTNTSYTVIGGIVGYYSYWYETTMNKCVNAGNVIRNGVSATKLYDGSGYLGTVLGRKYSGTVSDIISITTEQIKEYTEEQLKMKLGEAYTSDIKNIDGTWKYNNGYPILKWQLTEN